MTSVTARDRVDGSVDGVALVTGGAGPRLGQRICRRLAAAGATVVIADRSGGRAAATADALCDEFGDGRAVGFAVDVADREQVDELVSDVVTTIGPIRTLVNSAAVYVPGTITEIGENEMRHLIAVNLTAPWYVCRRVMPTMREHGGAVVNIGSVAADLAGSGVESGYAVAKAGLAALARACARDGGPFGIRANTISLGPLADSAGSSHAESRGPLLLPSSPTAEDAAEAVAFLASARGRHITGETISITSGLYLRP